MTTPTVMPVNTGVTAHPIKPKAVAKPSAYVPPMTLAERLHEHDVYSVDPTGGQPSRY